MESLTIGAEEVKDDKFYTICLQGYHFNNSKDYLNISNEDLLEVEMPNVVTTSAREVLEEFLRDNQNFVRGVEGRFVYK
jgi:5'-nucleotidase